ncbi:uncharacterized protein FFMR_06883 [Fusarium fujikuroi]|nr:uncharacterized protein FFC1_05486 [Fusarium fujikuroi]SCN93074.1 uncharacterized protein FFE2_07580 [Fusarium fujikuroi]SCO42168.1 uncharacterized protein FFNC_08366 [Fusarium fujikuroi]SCO42642.1 uncharacterized protein FFMR_06883 [Fusarium fujikuroi]
MTQQGLDAMQSTLDMQTTECCSLIVGVIKSSFADQQKIF